MSVFKINQQAYSSAGDIDPYDTTTLQSPEASIFINHKETYYCKKILDIGFGIGIGIGIGRTSFT